MVRASINVLAVLFVAGAVVAGAAEPRNAMLAATSMAPATPFPTCAPDVNYCVDTYSGYASPRAFSGLPPAVARELERRGCEIPQLRAVHHRTNVIHGSFRKHGQSDWVVLCAVRRVPSILIFWGGSIRDVTTLPNEGNFIAAASPQDVRQAWRFAGGFSSWRGPAPVKACVARGGLASLRHNTWICEYLPSPLDHDGMARGTWADGSFMYYLHRGKWITFPASE